MADYADTQEDVYYGDTQWQQESVQPIRAPESSDTSKVSTAVSLIGAVASLALMAGVGVWGYKLMMRDVSGVPVVRSAEGPMRVQPDDPGGRPAEHQGLAVNMVAAQGTAAPTADRLALAPRSVGLSEEDTPIAATPQPIVAPQPVSVTNGTAVAFQDGSIEALVDQLTSGGPRPIESDTVTVTAESPERSQEAAQANVVTGPGPARSWRPVARPANFKPRKSDASVVQAALVAPTTVDVNPDTLPAGTRLAQLGAYDSPEVARAEWDKFQSRFGDYMQGKQRVIQKASSGGRTFYRLRAMGFKDLSDARRFCSALVAEKADCIPVTTR